MKNNILSKLSFVFVAIFSFITFNGLVKADTVYNITSYADFAAASNTGGDVIWNIQNDITVTGEIYLNQNVSRTKLTINGNGHTITATQNSTVNYAAGPAGGYVFAFDFWHELNINDLNVVVGNGFRSGILFQSNGNTTLSNVNVTMAQDIQPTKNGVVKFTCPIVVNYSTIRLKGNNSVVANQWSWSAIDLTSNYSFNAVLEIQNDATLNITDNRSAERKAIDPVLKATIQNSSKTCQVINPERANLVRGGTKYEDPNTVFTYYFPINEVRAIIPEIKAGNVIPTSIAVTGTPTGSLKASTVPFTCYVSDTDKGTAPTDEEIATGIFEDGKYYYCVPNFDGVIDGSYRLGNDYTKTYVNGEEKTPEDLDQWIKTAYTYEVKEADELSFDKGKIETLVLTVDGDYSLFESLKVGDLTLEKDTDYKVTAGSTVITFTDEGLAKLNKLAKGNYDVEVKYTNGKTVTTTLTIDEIENPKTGVSAPYIVLGVVVLIGIISLIVVKKKYNN